DGHWPFPRPERTRLQGNPTPETRPVHAPPPSFAAEHHAQLPSPPQGASHSRNTTGRVGSAAAGASAELPSIRLRPLSFASAFSPTVSHVPTNGAAFGRTG